MKSLNKEKILKLFQKIKLLFEDFLCYIKKSRLYRSFTFRIFLLMLCIGIIPTTILKAAVLHSYENRAVQVRINEVSNRLLVIANHLLSYNYLEEPSSEIINAELEQLSNLYDGRVIVVNSSFNVIKDTYGLSVGKTVISQEVIQCFQGKSANNYDKVNGFIEITTPITKYEKISTEKENMDKESATIVGVMVTSVSMDSILETMRLLDRKAMIIQIIMCILIFAVAMAISHFLTRPFNKVTAAIYGVKNGHTHEALDVPDYMETEHIVDAFNQVLGRIRALDESREEFVSNVSHELKTPLASMKVLADSLLTQDEVPNELYREFMTDIADEIDRENSIITDLLTLVKLDKTKGELTVSSVSVNELIELILKRLRPIARKAEVEVIFESNRSVTAEVDEVKMTLAITNFVENAIKYNHERGYVKVYLDADHQFCYINIEDSGIGIPKESYERIFERFYREDKSHSREIGGTGLGLAIARNIIWMHSGTVEVESEVGVGTKFSLKIPLNYIPSQENLKN